MIGVILIATSKRYYGEMALQLAISLRLSMPSIKIACISDGVIKSVPGWDRYIDTVIDVPKGSNPFELKTRLYKLTPFKETLYIDADSVLLADHDLESLLSPLKGAELAMIEYSQLKRDSGKVMIWAKASDLYDHYDLSNDFPVYNSSFIYFRKSRNNSAFFKAANKAYLNPCNKVRPVGKYYPDEVAFGAASSQLAHYADATLNMWCYFPFKDWYSFKSVQDVRDNYPFISLASSKVPRWMEVLYNGTTSQNARAAKLSQYPFDVKKKEAWN